MSSASSPFSSSRISPTARTPIASGMGCPASTWRIRCSGSPWPYLVTISPPVIRSPNLSSITCAIREVALPAPMTISFPSMLNSLPPTESTLSCDLRLLWMQVAGLAASSAASQISRALSEVQEDSLLGSTQFFECDLRTARI